MQVSSFDNMGTFTCVYIRKLSNILPFTRIEVIDQPKIKNKISSFIKINFYIHLKTYAVLH